MVDLSNRQLRAVLTIAEKANISRAAVELSMSQPALSRSVKQIEKMLEENDTHGPHPGSAP